MTQTEFKSLKDLRKILEQEQAENLFIVTGKKSYNENGAKQFLETELSDFNTAFFNDFSPNPKLSDALRGVKLFKQKKPDVILAIGGGSVLDTAKIINALSAQPILPESVVKENSIIKKGVPLIAVPTTAGSGSEATHFAVVYLNGKKYSLAHNYLLPEYVILDSNLTSTNSPYLTACTGMDALSQAIESYWSVNATTESKDFARKAIKLILENLKENVDAPTNETRKNMLYAANLAGKAINTSKTTAPHAISYVFTNEWGVPHGHAVSLTLSNIFSLNSAVSAENVADPRGVEYVKATLEELTSLLNADSAEQAAETLDSLMESIGLERKLSKLKVKDADLNYVVENVNVQRLKNNPRKLTKTDLRDLLRAIY